MFISLLIQDYSLLASGGKLWKKAQKSTRISVELHILMQGVNCTLSSSAVGLHKISLPANLESGHFSPNTPLCCSHPDCVYTVFKSWGLWYHYFCATAELIVTQRYCTVRLQCGTWSYHRRAASRCGGRDFRRPVDNRRVTAESPEVRYYRHQQAGIWLRQASRHLLCWRRRGGRWRSTTWILSVGSSFSVLGGTAAAVPPPFRPGKPALCGSCPLVTPYYCRLGDLLCVICVYIYCLYFVCLRVFSCFSYLRFPL